MSKRECEMANPVEETAQTQLMTGLPSDVPRFIGERTQVSADQRIACSVRS